MSLQRNNHRSDDEQLLFAIWQELSKLDTNISGGFQGNGGWTDDGTSVRLTTSTDNVGIGIATPDARLHVSSDDVATPIFAAINSLAQGLVVSGDTNVGIGTSEPTYKLQVVGDVLMFEETSVGGEHSNINLSDISVALRHVDGTALDPAVRRGAIEANNGELVLYRGANVGAVDNRTALTIDDDVVISYQAVPLLTVATDGLVSIGATTSSSSRVRLFEDTDNGTNYVTLQAASAITTNKTTYFGAYSSGGGLHIYEPGALTGVCIGRLTGASGMTGTSTVIIGSNAGGQLTTATHNVMVGDHTGATLTDGGSNTLLGNGTDVLSGSINESIAIGRGATVTANNQLVIGSNAQEITTAYIGSGVTDSSPKSVTLNATGASGTNAAGANLSLAGGIATGTGNAGKVKIQTSVPTTSGTTAQTLADREVFVGNYRDLTESAATQVGTIGVPVGTVTGGTILVTVEANDGTDYQCRTLSFEYSAVNKAGTITIGISTPTEAVAVSTGTLTAAITVADVGSNNCSFYVNAVSSLTQTVLRASFQAKKNFGTGTIA